MSASRRERPQTAGRLDRDARPPGPKGSWFGDRRGAKVPTHDWHLDMVHRYGDVVYLRSFGPIRYYVISNPLDIERVLRTNQRNYTKPKMIRRRFGLLLGEGLFTSEGVHWLRQRRLAQPAFHRQRIATLAGYMTAAAEACGETWEASEQAAEPLDVVTHMMSLTLRVVGEALLGTDPNDRAHIIRNSFEEALGYLNHRLRADVPVPLWVPTSRNRGFRRARATLDREILAIIGERRLSGGDTGDLLSMLMGTRDEETGEGMSDRELRDELITILLAGHETSAVALSWVWYVLSQYPDVEARLHSEVDRVLGGRVPIVEDLPSLVYTRCVIEETLRLYPPAWVLVRQSKGEDELGGYRLPGGSLVVIYPYVTHRHPSYWQDPERFDPERFSPEYKDCRPQFAYFPFGGGPRQCIGSSFALMEAQLVVATLAQRFSLRLVPDHPVETQPMVTLRPRYGLRMTVQARERVHEELE